MACLKVGCAKSGSLGDRFFGGMLIRLKSKMVLSLLDAND